MIRQEKQKPPPRIRWPWRKYCEHGYPKTWKDSAWGVVDVTPEGMIITCDECALDTLRDIFGEKAPDSP